MPSKQLLKTTKLSKLRPNMIPFTLTKTAVERVKALLQNRPSPGIRVSVTSKGCSGKSYSISYADEIKPGEEKIEQDGITIMIDPKALIFVFGTEMDFVEETMHSGFVF